MAKGPPEIDLFKKANIAAVQRVVARARAREDRNKMRPTISLAGRPGMLSKAIDLALSAHGRAAKNKPSIRLLAPGSGGRPYHFGYSTVSKGSRSKPGTGSAGENSGSADGSNAGGKGASAGSGGSTGKGGKGKGAKSGNSAATGTEHTYGREAAHQKYTERDSAVERDRTPVDPDLLNDQRMAAAEKAAKDRDPDAGPEREFDRARNRSTDASAGIDGDQVLSPSPERGRHQTRDASARDDERGIDSDNGPEPGQGASRTPTRRKRENPLTAAEFVEEADRHRPDIAAQSNEAAAQAYIESTEKVARIMGTTSSFGTIGETLEERMRFWDLVHQHESSAGGRTQTRLVLELPHEASARDRHKIVREYVAEFEDKGIPYWASIHEPTKRNDSRNFHAHIVFTDRPMRQMPHPETGEMVWDFTIEETWRTKTSGNKRISHPYRQNRDPEMRSRSYIKASRERFANIVNDVMVESGVGVRYDPRSYKDMGLDVQPMRNVNRILSDKSKSQLFVYMDEDWTRRMIDLEIQAASVRRDATYQKLVETERQLAEVAADPKKVVQANRRLPPHLRMSPTHMLSRDMARRLATRMLETERNKLTTQFMDESTERTLKRIIEATEIKTTKRGMAKIFDPANAPDPEDLKALNASAKEELAAFYHNRQARHMRFTAQNQRLIAEWQSKASPTRPDDPPKKRPEPPSPGLAPSSPSPTPPRPPSGVGFKPISGEPWNDRTSARGSEPIPQSRPARSMPSHMRPQNNTEDIPFQNRRPFGASQQPVASAGPRQNTAPNKAQAQAAFAAQLKAMVRGMTPDLSGLPPENRKAALDAALAARIAELRDIERLTKTLEQKIISQQPTPPAGPGQGPAAGQSKPATQGPSAPTPQSAPATKPPIARTKPTEAPDDYRRIRILNSGKPGEPIKMPTPPTPPTAAPPAPQPALPNLTIPERPPAPQRQTMNLKPIVEKKPRPEAPKPTAPAPTKPAEIVKRPGTGTTPPERERPRSPAPINEQPPPKSRAPLDKPKGPPPADVRAKEKTPELPRERTIQKTPAPTVEPKTTAPADETEKTLTPEEMELIALRKKRRKAILSRRDRDQGR
jgi:hypothetical protein